MYTGPVVRVRLLAFIVTLVVAASPVLGLVCQMDCDQHQAMGACHESATSSDRTSLQSADHPCDHDHATGSLGVVTSVTSSRDAVMLGHSSPLVSNPSPSLSPEIHRALSDMHGPPDVTGRSVSSRTTILRI